jgi:hypothetical protein
LCQPAHLFGRQRLLQAKADFHERHNNSIIAASLLHSDK